jgi:SAM-dependent methyltransferase
MERPLTLPKIRILPDEPAVDEVVGDRIREYARKRGEIEILEAGCGRRWPYKFKDIRYVLTGVDLDPVALRIRQETNKDLDHAILGDLRTIRFEQHRFDIIYSAYVLEHVPHADRVLENFLEWVKPGGIMILKFPDRDSAYGFVTRFTPHWVHIVYKRYLDGKPNAGKPGFGPYPTLHEAVIARKNFHKFIQRTDLAIREEYGFGTLPTFQRLGARVLSGLSFGALTADYKNLLYILQSQPAACVDVPESCV